MVRAATSHGRGLLPANRVMRRLLGIREGFRPSPVEAQRSFQRSMLYSGTRCLLAYFVFPFVLPLVGLTSAVAAPVGLLVGVVATVSLVSSLRRFFGSIHRSRWWYTALAVPTLSLVLVLVVTDIRQLL